MPNAQATDSRIIYLDIIKCLAALMIVTYHSALLNESTYSWQSLKGLSFEDIILSLCSAGVPLFFMVNGALIAPRHFELKAGILKPIRTFIIAAFWTILSATLLIIVNPSLRAAVNNIPDFLHLPGYLWFLYSLAILYLYNIVRLHISRRANIILVSLLILTPFISNLIFDILLYRNPAMAPHSFHHYGLFTLYSIVYFNIGYWLHERKQPVKYWICLLLMAVGFALINFEVITFQTAGYRVDRVNFCFPTVGALLISISCFSLLQRISGCKPSGLRKSIFFIGSNAFAIYIFHPILFNLTRSLHLTPYADNAIAVTFAILIVVILSAAIGAAIKLTPAKALFKL